MFRADRTHRRGRTADRGAPEHGHRRARSPSSRRARPQRLPDHVRRDLGRPRRRPRRIARRSPDKVDTDLHRPVGAVHPRRRRRSRSSCPSPRSLSRSCFARLGSLGRLSRNALDLRHRDASTSRWCAGRRSSSSCSSSTSPCRRSGTGCRDPVVVPGSSALAFNYGAYMTEIFRAGIQAIPRGQIEAASALGMTERTDDAPDHPAAGDPDRHARRSATSSSR